MKTTTSKELGIAILSAHLPSKFQHNYLQKTKALTASKSSKAFPSLSSNIISPFQIKDALKQEGCKQRQKVEKSQRKYKADTARKQTAASSSKNVAELNKIKESQSQLATNPEHFLMRTQLFQKQKELKLQQQRRKKLYGAQTHSFHPNFTKPSNASKSEISQAKSEKQVHETSYKAMYYKKSGKLQNEEKKKKHISKYQQLMKQSIERFKEKFKSLEKGGRNESHSKKKKDLVEVNNSYETFDRTDIVAVEEKIKSLMSKLNIQQEINLSIQSIEELSRIQMAQEPKQSEISSSNIFSKCDQLQLNIGQICTNSNALELKRNQMTIQEMIQGELEQNMVQQQTALSQQKQLNIQQLSPAAIPTKNKQENIVPIVQHYTQLKVQLHPGNINDWDCSTAKLQRLTKQMAQLDEQQQKQLQQSQSQRQTNNIICKQVSLANQKPAQDINQSIHQAYQPIQRQQNVKEESFGDIQILKEQELSDHLHTQSFSFSQLHKPTVSKFLFNSQGNLIRKRQPQNKVEEITSTIQIVTQQILESSKCMSDPKSIYDNPQEDTSHNQKGQKRELNQQGKCIQEAEIEVENFGFCRFIIIKDQFTD